MITKVSRSEQAQKAMEPIRIPFFSNARLKTAVLLFASILLVLVCYGPTINLPYFWDDVPHFFLVINASYLDIWTNQIGYSYYRPLVFSLYKLVFGGLPFGATTLPHIAILLVHGTNSFLVGTLCRLFWQRQNTRQFGAIVVEISGSMIFALFPFAALPVIHFAAAMHPLVTLFALSGVIAALKFFGSGNMAWYGVAALSALAGPYLHESGVMIGSVIAMTWALYGGRAALRRWAWMAILPLASASFLVTWFTVPKPRVGGFHLGAWNEVLAKAAFFSQGLTYPLQPLATYLIRTQQWWDLGVMFLIGAGTLGLAAWMLLEQRRWKPFVLGAGWLGLTMLPTIAALPFSYMITSPRLIYFPGAGGAILWSSVIAVGLTNQKHRWLNWGMVVGWLFVTIMIPFAYVQREVRLHILALAPLQQSNQIAREYPSDRHLIVNTVNWLAYQNPIYPMGHDGVVVSADYILPSQLTYINTGIALRGNFITFDEMRPKLQHYYLSPLGEGQSWNIDSFAKQIGQYDKAWMTTYSESSAIVELVGNVTLEANATAAPNSYLANFEGKVYLTQGEYEVHNQIMSLTLDWWLSDPSLRQDATVFANVFDCAGNVIGLDSGYPLGRMLLLSALPTGSKIHDVHHIKLDLWPSDQCYRVEIGFFHGDGTRMKAYAPDGSQYPNYLFVLER